MHPRHVQKLYGHIDNWAQVSDNFANGKLPHAILLCGTRGIGKATFAYHMARFMLSGTQAENPHTNSLISNNCHPDLLVIEKEGEAKDITVDQLRQLGHFIQLQPAYSPNKMVIIDSADEMNKNAANALLKILEEPPANSFLILVAHTPGKLLATIRSRCRQVKMSAPL